ncbi:MAG: hypothetical protein R3D80_21705 [Paracoccaceae bacterium]
MAQRSARRPRRGVVEMRRERAAGGQDEPWSGSSTAVIASISRSSRSTWGLDQYPEHRMASRVVGGQIGPRQIGAEVEEIVLDAGEVGVGAFAGMKPRRADHRAELVDGAVAGLDPGGVFGRAAHVAERRVAAVAGAGVDLVQHHHGQPLRRR